MYGNGRESNMQGRRQQGQPTSGRGDRMSSDRDEGSRFQRGDERLREEVCEMLAHNGAINASDVEVNVSEGILTLTGNVENRNMKRMIEDAVDNIFGISEVKNEIKIQASGSYSRAQQTDSAVSASMGASTNTKAGATRHS